MGDLFYADDGFQCFLHSLSFISSFHVFPILLKTAQPYFFPNQSFNGDFWMITNRRIDFGEVSSAIFIWFFQPGKVSKEHLKLGKHERFRCSVGRMTVCRLGKY